MSIWIEGGHEMSKIYRNQLRFRNCNGCDNRKNCFLRKIPLTSYPEYVQDFVINIPNAAFKYQPSTRYWLANYIVIQERIVNYYDSHNCRLLGNEVRGLTNKEQKESDRQRIRELFKQFLDIASKATENQNSEASILFDGIGLVLASDYLEAVAKIFSMLKPLNRLI